MKKFALVLCILLILSFLGCGVPDESPTPTQAKEMMAPGLGEDDTGPVTVIYTDYYRLKLPNSWGNTCLCEIKPTEGGTYDLVIYEAQSLRNCDGGKLCTLMMVPTSDDDYKDFPDYELLCALDTPEGSFYVVALFPTDVQFDADTAESYNAMYEELMDVLYTIRPVGDIEMAMP